jgi:hypothetical protein
MFGRIFTDQQQMQADRYRRPTKCVERKHRFVGLWRKRGGHFLVDMQGFQMNCRAGCAVEFLVAFPDRIMIHLGYKLGSICFLTDWLVVFSDPT